MADRIENSSTNVQTINLNLSYADVREVNVYSNAGTTILNGVISGAGGLLVNDRTAATTTGLVVLNASNTMTGAVSVTAGRLRIANDWALGATNAGTTLAAAATLELTTNSSGQGISVVEAITNSGTIRNIAGTNTISGLVTLGGAATNISDAGTLIFNRAGASISGTADNLVFGGAGNIVIATTFSNTAGTLTKNGAGTLTLAASNAYSGATTINAGTIAISNGSAFGSNSVTFASNGTTVLSLASVLVTNNYVLTGNGTLDVGSNIQTNSGVISGAGSLTKVGAGTMILSGANTYTGDTVIGVGVARLSGSGRIADGSTLVVSNGATFDFNSISDTVDGIADAGSITLGSATLTLSNSATNNFSGSLSGAGGLIKVGAGTQILSGASSSYGGTTTVGGGVLRVTSVADAGDNSSIGTNGTIIITNSGVFDYAGTTNAFMNRGISLAAGSGLIGVSNSAASLTISGVISNAGSLIKTNAGTLILAASNSYSGTTLITNGVLNIQNGFALGSTNSGSGTTVGSGAALQLQGGIIVAAESLTLNGTGLSSSGALRSISGNNTYSGLISLGSASRINSDADTLTIDSAGSITNNVGVVFGGSGNIVLNDSIATGTGTLGKDGTGTLTLGVTNGYTGLTTISAGTLAYGVNNALSTGGITISNSLALLSEGVATLDIGSFSDSVGAVTLIDGNIVGTTGVLTSTVTYALQSGYVSASLAGAAAVGVIKTNANTLVLAGSNSFGGIITNGAGVLRAANNWALGGTGGSTLVSNNAALELSNNISIGAEALTINGTGISGTGALRNVSGTNTYGGTISFATAATIEADADTLLILTNSISGNNAKTFDGAGRIAVSGAVSGSGGVVKAGAGTLVLSVSNNFTGNLTNSAGTVRATSNAGALGAGNVIMSGGTLELANNTGLNFADPVVVTSGATIISDVLTAGDGVTHTLGPLTNGAQTVNIAAGANVTGGTAGIALSNIVLSASGGTYSVGDGASLTVLGGVTGTGFGFTVGGEGNTTINGSVATSTGGTLAKSGTGTLTLAVSNNYNGATTISNGVVLLSNGGGLGTTEAGTTVASGATLALQSGGMTVGAESLALSGEGLDGRGALRNIAGFNTFQGTITNVSAARINSDLNTLTLSGNINANNQVLTFGGSNNITVTGVISNSSAAIIKDGSGILTLSGLNTYAGETIVSGGTLALGTNNVIGSGAVTVNGGTLSLGAFSDSVGALTLISGSITGTGLLTASSFTMQGGTITANLGGGGGLTKNGADTLTLSDSNAFTGLTSVNGGTLAIASGAAVNASSGINLGNDTTLQFTGASGTVNRNIAVTNGTGTIRNTGAGTLTLSGNLDKNGTVLRFNDGTFNVTGVISGASADSDLIVDAATVTLSNANTYNGPTFIRNAGVLNANVAGALPTNTRTDVIMDDEGAGGSALNLGANQSIASLYGTNSSVVALGANTLTIGTSSGSTNFAGVISGTGGLVKDGGSTQILTGSNTFSGPLVISAGTLQVGNGSDAGSIESVSAITNNGTLSYQVGDGTRTLGATISGTGSLVQNSPGGILNVNGANSYSGGTMITAGELHAGTSSSLGTGAVTLSGTNPSSLAQLHYSNTSTPLSLGALSLNGNARLDLQPGSSMASTGILSIAGTNNAIFIAGNTWAVGTNTLVSGTSLSFGGGANIYLGGSSVNNTQVSIGATATNGRSSYTFNTNSTSFFVVVNGVSFDVVWSGAANNQWNTNSANWQQSTMGTNPSGTNIAFVNADDVYFGNAATSGAITVASGIAAADMFVTNSTGTVAFNGAQFSAFGLTKTGAGNLTVSNALVLIGTDLGDTNGTLLNSGSGNVALAGNFTQGRLVQAGTGTVTLSASNSFAGGVVASNGLVSATANNALGSGDLEVSGATVDVGATTQSLDQISLNSGSITGTGSIVTTGGVQAVDGSISAVIAGSGGLTKSGVGTVTLSGANTYTGSTAINGGTLLVGTSANLGNATNGLSFQGGTLRTTGSFATGRDVTMTGEGTLQSDADTELQLDGTIAGGGELTKSGAGTLTLTGNNTSFSGGTSLDGGTLRLGSATAAGTGALNQGAGTKLFVDTTGTIANNMTLRDVSFLQSATFSGALTLDGATFSAGSGITGTLSGVVGGTGGLTKTGAGTLALGSANTYVGGTLVSEGTLKVLAPAALQGNVTNNGILEIAVTDTVATNGLNISNAISGTGSLVRTGLPGVGISLTGSEDNTYTGLTTINSGTLRFDKSNGAQAVGGNVQVNGGALIITGNEQIPDDKTLTITGGTLDFSPNAAPGRTETLATLTKSGGTLRTYGNNLNVTNLNLSGAGTNWINANANGASGSITVRSGGTGLVMSGNDSPTITIGTGAAGTTNRLVLQNGVTANVTNGTAQILSASISGSATDVAGTIDLDGGDRVFNVSDGSATTDMLVSAAIINGGLTKTGDGRLTLSGSNSYAGGTLVSAGTLAGDTTSLQGAITNNAAVLFSQTTNGTYAGVLSGTGSVSKSGAGTLLLSGANSYSGGTTLSAGALRLGSTNATGTGTITQTDGSSTLVIDTTGTVANAMSIYNITTLQNVTLTGDKTLNNATYDVTNNVTTVESGQLSGAGGLTKEGAGTLVLAGSTNNTYTGATVLNAGALVLSNSSGNAINNSSSITVNAGASLILGASNQIGDGIGLTLNGGTFIVGTDTAGYSETLGQLTLSASSTIDLGSYSTGLRTLTFANSSNITWSTNAVLTITNWQGINRQSSDVAEIIFGVGGLSTTQLAQIYFANQDINGGMLIGGGELVPVPEAEVYWAALAIALAIGYRERRRLIAILQHIRK